MGEIPVMNGRAREDGAQTARRDPPPPVADTGQIGEHLRVGAKSLGAGGGDATNAVRVHATQFDPAGHRGETQDQTYH